MHLYTADGKIARYDQPTDIIADFFPLRLEFYTKRKDALLENSAAELLKLDNKVRSSCLPEELNERSACRLTHCPCLCQQARFIVAVVNEEFSVNNQSRGELLRCLEEDGYHTIGGGDKAAEGRSSGYDYLLRMPVRILIHSMMPTRIVHTQAPGTSHCTGRCSLTKVVSFFRLSCVC